MILKNRAACYLKLVSTGDMFCPETLFRVKTLPNDDDYEGGGGKRDRGTGRSKLPASYTLHGDCCPFFLASSL